MADPRVIEFEGRRISVPPDATDAEIAQIVGAPKPEPRAARLAGFGALGFNDAVASGLGMPVDMASDMMRRQYGGTGVARAALGAPASPPSESAPFLGSQSWRNIFDYLATAPGRVSDAVEQGSLAPFTESRTARDAPQDRGERIFYGAGKGIGGAATSVVPAAAVANMAPAGSMTQAIAQQLAARPAMQAVSGGVAGAVTEDTKNPWLGMAAGAAVPVVADAAGGMMKRLLTPGIQLTPDEQRIAAAALARDIPLTPAQATGSGGLHRVEQTLRRLPGSGNLADRGFDQQRQALNRSVLEQAGITADRAGPGVIDDAYRTIGGRYDDLIRRTGQVAADSQFADDVASVAKQYGRRLETDVAPVFRSYVEDLQPLVNAARTPGSSPQMAADVYNMIRSDITTRARQTNNTALRDALIGLRDALDGAATRTRPDLTPEWEALRGQYRNLSIIDKAMRGAPAPDASAGNIPLGQFRNAVRGADPNGFARGRGDMNELAQIAGFLQNRVPNSGTPERLAMTGLLAGGAAFEPTTAAMAVGVPTAIQAAYGSAPVRQFLTTPPQPFMGQTAPTVENILLQRLADQLRGGSLVPK